MNGGIAFENIGIGGTGGVLIAFDTVKMVGNKKKDDEKTVALEMLGESPKETCCSDECPDK